MSEAVEVEAKATPEDRFTWRGLRFQRKPPRGTEVLRYECDDFGYHCWLRQEQSGQWIAAFVDGVAAIEWEPWTALEGAAKKAIDHYDHCAAALESLLRAW